MNKIGVAVIGPGNIGTDLMLKVFRSTRLEMRMMVGVVESAGIERARQRGVPATTRGIDDLLARKDELGVQIVFAQLGIPGPKLIREQFYHLVIGGDGIGDIAAGAVCLSQEI